MKNKQQDLVYLKNEMKLKTLAFISSDLNNMILLKRDGENNISTIVKYYALAIGSIFAFIVFYQSKINTAEIIYPFLGLVLMIFLTSMTYFTSYAISKNIKRRIIYRKEIIALRSIANKLMGNIYTNTTTCALNSKNINFSNFESIPNIGLLISMALPFLTYYFSKPIFYYFKIGFLTIPVTISLTVIASSIMLNLYTHHRREMLIANHFNQNTDELKLKLRIKKIDVARKKRKEYKFYKKLSYFLYSLLFCLFIYYHNPLLLNQYFMSIAVSMEIGILLVIVMVHIRMNRFKNMHNKVI
jgi:hypothetical protein